MGPQIKRVPSCTGQQLKANIPPTQTAHSSRSWKSASTMKKDTEPKKTAWLAPHPSAAYGEGCNQPLISSLPANTRGQLVCNPRSLQAPSQSNAMCSSLHDTSVCSSPGFGPGNGLPWSLHPASPFQGGLSPPVQSGEATLQGIWPGLMVGVSRTHSTDSNDKRSLRFPNSTNLKNNKNSGWIRRAPLLTHFIVGIDQHNLAKSPVQTSSFSQYRHRANKS